MSQSEIMWQSFIKSLRMGMVQISSMNTHLMIYT